MPHKLLLKIAYDGTSLLGWQKTFTGQSVEESLEKALIQILQHPIKLEAASRTDAHVHAKGQIVVFQTEKTLHLEKLMLGLNALLSADIRVLEAVEVPESFHPTLNALGKEYSYELCLGPVQYPHFRHFSWHRPKLNNLQAMQEASLFLIGEHDFKSLCNQRKNLRYPHFRRKVEKVEITTIAHNRLRILVRGNHFLYKMVRNMVGLLVAVGENELSADAIPAILTAQNRVKAAVTAPAHGLTLEKVFYSSFSN